MRRCATLLLLLLAAGAFEAGGEQRQMALGAAGELYRVVAGAYGDLFTDGEAPAENPALALEVVPVGGVPYRELVPGTQGIEVESAATLVYEEGPGTVFVIWESRTNLIHSQIKLASLDAAGVWSEPMDLPGEFFSLKTSPRLAITKDTFITLDGDGDPVAHDRTIYHVLWWEEAAAGQRVVYSPFVLVDGAYIGWSPLFDLGALGFGGAQAESALPTQELVRSPTIQAGRDGNALVAGIVDPASGSLMGLEIQVVPGELSALAGGVREEILDAGNDPRDPAGLADRARAYLIDIGHRLRMHDGVLDYLGKALWSDLVSQEGGPAGILGDRARAYLIDIGARMAAQGMARELKDGAARLLEFPNAESGAPEGTLHSLRVRLAAVHPIPETGAGATTLYLSRTGEAALVAWQEDDLLRYRETEAEGWSEVRHLELGAGLELDQARTILEQRTLGR